MRFKIHFTLNGESKLEIPTHYHVEFSNWIYKVIHFQNPEFIDWLKNKSYLDHKGEFRMYTFSDLILKDYKISEDKIIINDNSAAVVLSFYADPEMEPFVEKAFKDQSFKLGEKGDKISLSVSKMEKIDLPRQAQSKVKIKCLSPMLITEPGKSEGPYLSPDQKDFDKHFFKSLMFKYANLIKFMGPEAAKGMANLNDLEFNLKGKPKSRIVKIKTDTPHQKSVKGYIFNFELKAPENLIEIGINSGFGELNHLGFGCCEIV